MPAVSKRRPRPNTTEPLLIVTWLGGSRGSAGPRSGRMTPLHIGAGPPTHLRTFKAMVSRYHVVGKLIEDPMIDAWLGAREIPTLTR